MFKKVTKLIIIGLNGFTQEFTINGYLQFSLKELYTSISTLAQELVLTLLNNKFIFNPVLAKNPQTFLAKTS